MLQDGWTAKGYLMNATSFSGLFEWLAQPQNLIWVDFLNKWGVMALGLALVFGVFVNFVAVLGILLMVLYYLPGFDFPYAGEHSLLIDEHVIYSLALFLLIRLRAGKDFGIKSLFGGSSY